jgi:hypothetical protein
MKNAGYDEKNGCTDLGSPSKGRMSKLTVGIMSSLYPPVCTSKTKITSNITIKT